MKLGSQLNTHIHRPDRRAHRLDAGGWLPMLPLDLRPGVGSELMQAKGMTLVTPKVCSRAVSDALSRIHLVKIGRAHV